MEANAVVEVTPEGKLDLPPEIQHRIKPGDRYRVSMTDNSIVFEKIPLGKSIRPAVGDSLPEG